MSETLFPNATTLQHNAACVDCICVTKWDHVVVYSYILATWRLVVYTYILATWRPDLRECKIHGEEIAATWAFIVVNKVDDFKIARLAM